MDTKLTSRDLPHASPTNTESLRRRAQLHRHTSVENKKHHLHLSRILDPLGAARRQIDHSGAKEREGQGLCEAEICALDIAHLDSAGGVGDICFHFSTFLGCVKM